MQLNKRIDGKSGGILKGVCIHDVVYVHKVYVEPESQHDYFVVLSMLFYTERRRHWLENGERKG